MGVVNTKLLWIAAESLASHAWTNVSTVTMSVVAKWFCGFGEESLFFIWELCMFSGCVILNNACASCKRVNYTFGEAC